MKKIAFTIFFLGFFINSAMSQNDPLKAFQKIVSNCQAAFDARQPIEVAFGDKSQKWRKQQFVAPVITYDVRKTDSLVSPFSAVINLKEFTFMGNADTEQSATSLNFSEFSSAYKSDSSIRFAMQDGNWVFKSWVEVFNAKLDGQKEFSIRDQITLQRTPQQLLGPRVLCLS